MTSDLKPSCRTCVHWRDYSDRVYAKISSSPHGSTAGLHELRICRYTPPPSVGKSHPPVVYTDGDHHCSEWKDGKE